jgi:hypothetical protein
MQNIWIDHLVETGATEYSLPLAATLQGWLECSTTRSDYNSRGDQGGRLQGSDYKTERLEDLRVLDYKGQTTR